MWQVIRPAERDPERWGQARCNDGSATSVAVNNPVGGSKDWVIRVAGGYYCDETSLPCSKRPKRFTTGIGVRGEVLGDGADWPGHATGMFMRDAQVNPDFAGANHALLHYCSSDLWLGENPDKQPNSASQDGWYFTGRINFRAGIEALELAGMDRSDPQTRVLLVGQSSGGIGLANNLHLVTELFPKQVEADGVKVIIDGGWIPPLPMQPAFQVNRWGTLLPACEAQMRKDGRDPAECLFGVNWYPFWKQAGVDVLVAQSGLDVTQLKQLGIEGSVARSVFRDQVRESLMVADHVLSGGWSYHVLAFDMRLSASPFGHLFYEQAEGMWRDEEPKRVFHRYNEAP